MYKILLFTLSVLIAVGTFAQEAPKKKKIGVKLSGFVKTDVFSDTRETVSAREGHFLLWPANESLDANGNDVNAKSSFNMLSVQSRLKATIKGPDAFGAKVSGVIEADFFGSTNGNINTLRLRHAFIKMNWTKSELLMGQYWHPMFQGVCYPTTVSFNSGAGVMPFARNPQIRYSYNLGQLKLVATAFSERDHSSAGIIYIDGEAKTNISSTYIRNSGMPGFNGLLQYSFGSENAKMLFGAAVNYLTTKPQQTTSANYITNEQLGALSAVAFYTLKTKAVNVKLSAVYGENMVNTLSFGGFAIKDTINMVTKEVSYTPITNGALWTDISTNGKKVQFGLLAGINKNLGTKDDVNGPSFGRATNIAQVTRVSPRIVFISGKLRLGFELEISGASYGDGTYDARAIPQNSKTFTNYRALASAMYLF